MTGFQRWKIAGAYKSLAPNWQVTVQSPAKMLSEVPGRGEMAYPGFTQIDGILRGKNIWSRGPQTLQANGFHMPDFQRLPQGKYSVADAMATLNRPGYGIPPQYTSMLSDMKNFAPKIFNQVKPSLGGSPLNSLPILKSIRRAGIVPRLSNILQSVSHFI